MSNDNLRLRLRTMRFNMVERWYDFVNILFPIFLVSGLLVACFTFWLWVFRWVVT